VTHRPPATFPPPNTFNRKAKEVYLIMRRPKVSPNGLASAIQMTQFFINRAGKAMPEKQKHELRKAIEMLRIELRFLKQSEACGLKGKAKPVHPPPAKRIGGRFGYNWKG
jgi:hypothetical protein